MKEVDCMDNKLTYLTVPDGTKCVYSSGNNIVTLKKEIVEYLIPSLVNLCVGVIFRTNTKVNKNSIPRELHSLIDNSRYVTCFRCKSKIPTTMVKYSYCIRWVLQCKEVNMLYSQIIFMLETKSAEDTF